MFKVGIFLMLLLFTEIRCGYDFHGFHGGAPLIDPLLLKGAIVPGPVLPAPAYVKAIEPVPAPIFHGAAPIYKAFAPPPATSYATVTQVHVTHPQPILKAVVAPAPIFKTLALPAPIPIAAHGYPHYPH